ncbi:MAG TPA: non-ribosomal peptide synthetase, partial [Candidatus Binatia bacterium]|nr:non-ribosomal peptide synthetase [Candidatus Binatia bacterium]
LRDPQQLADWLRRHQVSILHLTPALGRFLQAAEAKALPALRRVFFGGDVLSYQDVAAMRGRAPNATIASFYGASETQRAVGCFTVPPSRDDDRAEARPVPIGRGAPGVQLLVLTATRQLAGIGEPGELYIRSPHLAAGYVDDDELTQASFVINPFTRNSRDRLYRTRESGRYLPDGNVEWLGRYDRRASIRGFRVGLDEIESCLAQYPGVRCAAVVAREDPVLPPLACGRGKDEGPISVPAGEVLVAYVECEAGRVLETEPLRDFLRTRLPDYMMPSYFSPVERMPLNANGKIDYLALPAVDHAAPPQRNIEAPANDLERAVAAIFAAALQMEQIGRREDFFALGGHSLLAAKVAAKLREALALPVELRTLLECPNVEALCRCIQAGARFEAAGQEREEIEL